MGVIRRFRTEEHNLLTLVLKEGRKGCQNFSLLDFGTPTLFDGLLVLPKPLSPGKTGESTGQPDY